MHPLQDSVRPKHKHFPLPKPTSEKVLQSRSFGQVYGPYLRSTRSALLTRPGVRPERTPDGVDIGVVLLDEGHVAAGLEYHEREVRSQEVGTTELVVEWAELVWEPGSD
jgi:hypothetical protein